MKMKNTTRIASVQVVLPQPSQAFDNTYMGVGGGEEIYSIWILLALPALLLAGPALHLQDEMPVVTKE